jgi:copper chaperone CopZ
MKNPGCEAGHVEALEAARVISRGHPYTSGRRLKEAGIAVLVLGLIFLLPACGGGTAESSPQPTKATAQKAAPSTTSGESTVATGAVAERVTASYVVPTITCPGCAARVQASAGKAPGVIETRVEGQNVTVTYDPKKTDSKKIASAIREGGDTVQPVDR